MKRKDIIIFAYEKGYRVNKNGEVISHLGNKLSPNSIRRGYHRFSLKIDNIRYVCFTHTLQAYQKFGEEMFKEGIQVRHLNGNSLDNSYNNIDIGTASDNMMDKDEEVRKTVSLNAGLNNSPLNYEEVKEIRKRVKNKNYKTYQDLAEEYGLKSKSTISGIVNNNHWNHL